MAEEPQKKSALTLSMEALEAVGMAPPSNGVKDAPVASPETVAIRKRIYAEFPAEYADGARRAMAGNPDYPPEFHHPWTKDQRNAWFAGYNAGREKRLRGAS